MLTFAFSSKYLSTALPSCYHGCSCRFILKEIIYVLFFSSLEIPVDRTQITGWKDLLLQYRDQAVHMGETWRTQISCRSIILYPLHNIYMFLWNVLVWLCTLLHSHTFEHNCFKICIYLAHCIFVNVLDKYSQFSVNIKRLYLTY